MIRFVKLFVVLCLSLSLLSSCTMSRLLKENRTEMQRLAYGDLNKKEKFDGLAEVLVNVLEASLEFDNPLQSYKYLNKFSQQNRNELRSINQELGPWIKQMGMGEKITFTSRAMARPYSRRLVQVVPKVQKMAKENDFELGPLQKAMLLYKIKGLLK